MVKWIPDCGISEYPSIKDGRISIVVHNESKTRRFRIWLTLDEARKFGESIIESVDRCEHIIDMRKKSKVLNK